MKKDRAILHTGSDELVLWTVQFVSCSALLSVVLSVTGLRKEEYWVLFVSTWTQT